jgi:transcriptional regulator with PAS, ATPase and Fis domain
MSVNERPIALEIENLTVGVGKTGTGKSHLARRIHLLSKRRDKPFIEVALTSDIGADNLIESELFGHEKGAFTGASEQKQGLFSLADGGTIFLDEIGDATADLQAKLLRVLEMKRFRRLGGVKDLEVDVRVIVATNRDLERAVADGKFRQDLYYRLNVISIRLPALRF